MNKTELIDKVAKKTGLVAVELDAGRKVQITGFGTFVTRRRKKRMGRNPQTGEAISIPATKFPAFAAGKALKTRIAK